MANGNHAYDAIVVGGGHNGLAAYLARAGARTLVLESHGAGAATTEAPWADAPPRRVTLPTSSGPMGGCAPR